MWDQINNSEKKNYQVGLVRQGSSQLSTIQLNVHAIERIQKKKKVAANKFGTTLNHPIKRSCERAQKKIAANKFGK